jgi:hypothetical protein
MGDITLRYSTADVDELQVGECTIRRTRDDRGLHWRLWLRICDEIGANAGTIVMLGVAVDASGAAYHERDDGMKIWALRPAGPGAWQVEPSIDAPDIWHHTPLIVGVPASPPWTLPPSA